MMVIDDVEFTGTDVEMWKIAGWVFYNAQNVKIEVTSAGRSRTIDYLSAAPSASNLTSTVPKLAYYVVPALVLLVAGYVAYQRSNRSLGAESAAGVGAAIAGGYVVLSAAGVFVFEYTQSSLNTTGTAAPKLSTAILVAGLVYPVVLGAIGGYFGVN